MQQQGFKAAVISHVQRPVPKVLKEHPDVASQMPYIDLLALDSEYDYDPFWAKCVELKVAVTTHATMPAPMGEQAISSLRLHCVNTGWSAAWTYFAATGKLNPVSRFNSGGNLH